MKQLKTIALDLGNGFWGMMQEDVKQSGVINFVLTHEDYSTMIHVLGIEAEWDEDLLNEYQQNLIDATVFFAETHMN